MDVRYPISFTKCQIYQSKELESKKKEQDNEIADLQKNLSAKEKVQRKLKSDLENSNKELRTMKFFHQRLWNLVVELAEALSKAGESLENVKAFLHGLSLSSENPPLNNSDATTTSHNFLRPCDPATSTPAKPLQNASDDVAESSTQTLKGKLRNTQENNSSAATSASGSCISPRVKSFGSNYFLKTYKEVIEDPHVFDDCLDISFTDLRDLRQQFSLRNETFTPISPLPPIPPPKSAKSKIRPSEQLARPLCSSKRLNFRHQQSESFDIQSNEQTDFPAEQPSELVNNKYALSTKRNRDGSLKFDFSANMNTTLLLDINTLQISCTVMPTDPTQTSLSEWKNSPIPTTGNPSCFSSTHSPLAGTGIVDTTDSLQHTSGQQENASEVEEMHKKTKKFKHSKITSNEDTSSQSLTTKLDNVSLSSSTSFLINTNLSPGGSAKEMCTDVSKENLNKGYSLSTKEEVRVQSFASEMQRNKEKSAVMGGLDSSITDSFDAQTNQEPHIDVAHSQVIQEAQKMDELDFTGILLNPFNPSTFTPRGLFCSSVKETSDSINSNSSSKPYNNISVMQHSTAAFKNNHLFSPSSCHTTGSTYDEIRSDELPHSQCFRNTSSKDSEVRERSNVFQEKTDLTSPLKHSKETTLQTLRESGQDTIENQKTTGTNGFVDSANSVMEESDGIGSDHSLVIADSVEDTEQTTSFCDVDNEKESTESPSKLFRKPSIKKTKKKCLFSKRKRANKSPTIQRSVPEVNDSPQGSIAAAFKTLEEMKFTDAHFKQNEHTLANAFINPINASDSKDIVYHVLKYLHTSRANPLMNYHLHQDPTVLLPLSEKCIVSALIKVCRRKRLRLQGLLESTVKTSYHLILSKDKFSLYGLSSICRIMTEICKHLEDRDKPLRLCSELLKVQHMYTPYLIASIAGVWKELFDVENVSDEERIFHSCIVYGVQRKPRSLTDQQWKHCNSVLTTHLTAPLLSHLQQTVAFLIQTIQLKCKSEDIFVEEEYMLTTPLVVLAALEGWGWAKENLIDEYIIPLLVKFSEHEVNEQAFSLFCHLYADVCNFCPDEEEPHEVLVNFFESKSQTEGNFIKDAVAMAQLKLLLHKKQLVPYHLTDWIKQNQGEKEKEEYAFNLFRRRLMVEESELLASEIL